MNRLKRFLSTVAAVAVLGSAAVMSVSAEELGGLNVTPLTDVEIENAAQNVSAEEVEPLGNGLKGSKITIQAELDPIDNGNFVFPGHHDDRAKVITGAAALTGSTGVVFYVDLPSANKFCFVANINSPHDERWNNDFNADMMMYVDYPYYVLPWSSARRSRAGYISRGIPCGWTLALNWMSARIPCMPPPCIRRRWAARPAA